MLPYTRREFAKFALAALPAAGLLTALNPLRASAASAKKGGKPNSKVAGVQIGLNVPYSFANQAMSNEDIISNCVQLGVSALELRMQPVEIFLGAPANLVNAKAGVAVGGAAADNAAKKAAWRQTVVVDRVKALRKMYEDAGLLIEILKVDAIFKFSDAELDYSFAIAKALGARAISTEISHSDEEHQRLGRFADKHKLMVGLHGHATTTVAHWEKAFAYAKYLGANLDLGHFVAGNNISPVPFMKQYHDRITHIHVKDRKMNNGATTAFGEGDTPIGEVLRLIRDNKWKMQATIEFEYKFPATTDRMTELARSIKFCRDALA
jgi:hypothetical protein